MSDSIDIIMLALPRWDAPYSSTAYSLAKEFSKNNRVFYIDNPITLKYFVSNIGSVEIRRRKKALLFGRERFLHLENSGKGNLVAVTPGLTLPINFLPKGKFYNTLSSFNDSVLFKTLRDLLVKYSIKEFIFINSFNPFYLRELPDFFKPKRYIYHVVDDIRYSPHVRKHGPMLEDEVIRRSDLVIATSRQLQKMKLSISKNTFYLPNAADISLFKTSLKANYTKPPDIAHVDKQIVIYTGHIDGRIDFDLLKYCLTAHDDKLFLMVGPTSLEKDLFSELTSFSNILFIGRKDIAELPAYLQYASCAIIPFKCNTLTSSIYPLKINEYLAAGKPVVSTSFSDDILNFEEVIEIQNSYDNFSNCINMVLNDSPKKLSERLLVAEQNTWEARVKLFWEILDNVDLPNQDHLPKI